MLYSLVGINALLVCLIINKDILFKRIELTRAYKVYRLFLITTMVFFITDSIWGLFDQYHLILLLTIDTILFFIAMNLSVVLWTIFVASYVNKSKRMNFAVFMGGLVILLFLIATLIVNIFYPILFRFEGNDYIPCFGRTVLYLLQIILFAVVSIVSLALFFIEKNNSNRYRYLAIGLFGLFMALSIVGQLAFPLLPIYSIGSIIGICLIHIFVVSSGRYEVLNKLHDSLEREKITGKELDFTKALVYIDPLTGAKSKHAFVEIESKIDKMIADGKINSFSIVVFDINGLKIINDTKGHEYGDMYIKDSYKIIKSIYGKSEVYRFGGDEFVAILEGEDYDNKDLMFNEFNTIIENNLLTDKPVISAGMANFELLSDNTFNSVFIRADKNMYIRKRFLKSQGVNDR